MNGQSREVADADVPGNGGSIPHANLVELVVCGDDQLAGQALPTPIHTSWQRCLNDFKLDPARDYEPRVLDPSRIRELQGELEELVQIAQVEMDALYEQISGSGLALLLADMQGVILVEKVDPALQKTFAREGLIVGAEWSEQREGTNGIGTCAAEARPITIHQSDHFRSCHSRLSCSAAPIHDQTGRVIAVLDASCVNATGPRESQVPTIALVSSSARLIEKYLFLRRHQGDWLLRFHLRPESVDMLHDGAIALCAQGRIVASDATAAKLLGVRDRKNILGKSIDDIFDATFEQLLATRTSARRALCQLRENRHGRRYFASLVEAGKHVGWEGRVTATSSRTIVHLTREQSTAGMTLADLAGDDPQMLRNVRNAQRVANSTVAVLIQGPTGSGKEAFAKALHLASRRARQAFVALNCAAIPESLIESELFGYAPGTFTGARREGMRGRIVQSSGGTLFLDEIGDMPLMMQSRLLRVLAEQEVAPLGSESLIKVDLRVICATHRDLPDLIARGQFREDLYYRLNGITLQLPRLSARQDKGALIRNCIARESGADTASIEAEALEMLLCYEWPGNIRELLNAIRSALAICEDSIIRVCDLPGAIREPQSPAAYPIPESNGADECMKSSREAAECEALVRSIEKYHGNMTKVANRLGISRNTLYRKIKRYSIKIGRHTEPL